MTDENEKPTTGLRDAMNKPKSTTVDNTQSVSHPLPDLIKAEEHLTNQQIARNPAAAIKTFRVGGNSMR